MVAILIFLHIGIGLTLIILPRFCTYLGALTIAVGLMYLFLTTLLIKEIWK